MPHQQGSLGNMDSPAMSNLALVQQRVADHMDKIHDYFKPGVKVTVIVRTPDFPDRDFLMTADDIPELIAFLRRRQIGEKTP
jgi:hypothetical protein